MSRLTLGLEGQPVPFPPREGAPTSRELFGSIADIAHSFDGEFVAGVPDDTRKKVTLMVAAMSQASLAKGCEVFTPVK